MKTINKISRVVNIITKAFAYVSAVALLFNIAIILLNVVLRAFGKAVIGTEEFVSVSEVVLIFLALGYTQYNRGLVHVAFFMKKLPGLGPVIAWALHQWIGAVVVALLVYETVLRVPMVKQFTTALLIPYKPFYVVIAVGFSVYLLAQIYEAVKSTVAIFNAEVRQDVVDNLPA